MEIAATVNIPASMTENLIVSAFEGGSTYWAIEANPVKINDYAKDGIVWWGHTEVWDGPVEFELIYATDPDWPSEGTTTKKFTQDDIKRAYATMAAKFPHHFANVVSDETDAETGDVFLQCIVFDDIVYG